MSTLENHYRRLLAWYPRDHRAAHEDEMVGVLLASAEPEQTRPTAGERADLLWGGLKLHTRRTFGRASGPSWRDALAVAGVLGTLVLMIPELISTALWLRWEVPPATQLIQVVLIVAVATGVAANQRWVAAPAAWLLLPAMTPWAVGSPGPYEIDSWTLLALGTAVALTLTRSPRRGLRLAGARGLLTLAVLVTMVMAWETAMFGVGLGLEPRFQHFPLVATCALAAGYALSSSLGRRCLAILALPLVAGLVASEALLLSMDGWLMAALLGLAVVPFAVAGRMISKRGKEANAGGGAAAGDPA
ncbi:hypothetical protein [Flindersiella endophytica]